MQNDLKWMSIYKISLRRQVKESISWGPVGKQIIPSNIGLTTYCTKIRPILEYAAPIWAGLPHYLKEDIERVQNPCLEIVGLPRNKIESLASRRNYLTSKEYDNILNSENHPCKRLICSTNAHEYNLRTGCNPLLAPTSFTDRHRQSFIPRAAWLNYFNEHS
jgi:hypothetical protein